MTWDSAGEGKLYEQLAQSRLVLADVRINFAVGAFEVSVADHRRSAVAGTGNVDHVEIVLADDAVQVHIDEILSWRRPPVAEQHVLHIAGYQRALQQWIVVQVDLPN